LILLVEDDDAMADLLVDELGDLDYRVEVYHNVPSGLAALEVLPVEVIVTDVRMKGPSGLQLCQEVSLSHPDIPVLVVTAFGSMDTAIGALRAGAYDFLTKPFEVEVLAHSIARALERRHLQHEVRRLRSLNLNSEENDGILGNSQPMVALRDLVRRIAKSDANVLLRGESGTGKELVAKAIHRQSPRSKHPFVAINCSAIPEPLLESELFGHVEGAFTGARAARKGLFRDAEGGTLFLDEIGELPLSLQPKLLRALQERRVRPVGGDREIPTNVRILSATHRDLEESMEEGSFRRDLFYRIQVIEIPLVPLRKRGNDILQLAQFFLKQIAARAGQDIHGFDHEVARQLLSYSWPGNVRELQNCLERAIALSDLPELHVASLPETLRDRISEHIEIPLLRTESLPPLVEIERRYISQVLEAVGGNKSTAAKILGIDRKTLRIRLKKTERP
jgi:two-component system response regulator HydG